MQSKLIDSRVAQIKFDREVEQLLILKENLREKGWIIESTLFPIVRVTFLANRLLPPIAALMVDIDFTNYNLWPPSVRFLHPATLQPIIWSGLQKVGQGNIQNVIVNSHPITLEPFLCIQGVREYHTHPQHDGNSWDLHRYSGQGTLFFLLDKIYEFCIDTIKSYSITIQVQAEPNQVQVRQELI
jgi:hypothetical protein